MSKPAGDNKANQKGNKAIETYRNLLLDRKKTNLHKPFFDNDKYLECINCEIMTEAGKKTIPFRNPSCKEPFCIYDIEDLIQRFKQAGFTEKYDFMCEYCDVLVSLKKFEYDITLAEGINVIWQQSNHSEETVKEVKIYKDGRVMPSFGPESETDSNLRRSPLKGYFLKTCKTIRMQIQENLPTEEKKRTIMIPTEERKKTIMSPKNQIINTDDDRYVTDGPVSNMRTQEADDVEYKEESLYYMYLPKLGDFSKSELITLYRQFVAQKVAFPFHIKIDQRDMEDLRDENRITFNVVAFFVRYIKNHVKLADITKKEEEYFLAINVEKYDKGSKKAKYNFLWSFSNKYRSKLGSFHQNVKRVCIVFKHDDRWFVALVDTIKAKCYLSDFLTSDLSRTSKEEIYQIVKAVMLQEFEFATISVTFYDKERSQNLSDCGIHVLKFLELCYIEGIPFEKINVTENEKNKLRRLLPWLILKLANKNDETPHTDEAGNIVFPSSKRPQDDFLSRPHEGSRESNRVILPPIQIPSNSVVSDKQLGSPPKKYASKASLASKAQSKAILDALEPKNDMVKISKTDLQKMLGDFKEEFMKKYKDSDDEDDEKEPGQADYNNLLDEVGITGNKPITNNQVKALANKLKARQMPKKVSPQEFYQLQMKYQQEAIKFYNMLVYFQKTNPDIYARIAAEIQSKIEDNMLSQFEMLHLKYPEAKPETPLPPLKPSKTPIESVGNSLQLSKSPSSHYPPLNPGSLAASFNIGYGETRRHTPDNNYVHPGNKVGRASLNRSNILTLENVGFNRGTGGGIANSKGPIVAKRYGFEVTKREFDIFRNQSVTSNAIVDIFLGYLRESQENISAEKLNAIGGNILYLSPEFYDALTNFNHMEWGIDYEKVRGVTSKYQGSGKTVFDLFHKIVIIVKANDVNWYLILIHNQDKKIFFFDTLQSKSSLPGQSPILMNILEWMKAEYQYKGGIITNLSIWDTVLGEVTKPYDSMDRPIVVLKLAHNIQKGSLNGVFKDEDILKFRLLIADLMQAIGVTANKKGEIPFKKMPI